MVGWQGRVHATYPARLLAFLQVHLPEHDTPELPVRADQAMWRAGVWDLEDERSITTFVVLAIVHGLTFDEQAWARTVLMDTRLAPPEKINTVYEVAIRRAEVAGTPLADREEA